MMTLKYPKGLKYPVKPVAVQLVDTPNFACTNKIPKGVKGKGIRYERKIVEHLDNSYKNWEGLPGQWFEYLTPRNEIKYAQADWLGFCPEKGLIGIVEVKLTRVPKAWFQLNHLYKPLVQAVFPTWKIACIEISTTVKNVKVPEEVTLVRSLDQAQPDVTKCMWIPYNDV